MVAKVGVIGIRDHGAHPRCLSKFDLQVMSVAYTAASPSTMTARARKAVTVSSTTAVSLGKIAC